MPPSPLLVFPAAPSSRLPNTLRSASLMYTPPRHFFLPSDALRVRYTDPEIALNTGNMLRECIRHEPLAKLILHNEVGGCS